MNWEIMIRMNINWDIYMNFVLFHFKITISKMKFNDIINNIGEILFKGILPYHHNFIFSGQSPAEAESNYLHIASTLDMYGVELHKTSVKVRHFESKDLFKCHEIK